MHTRKSSLQDIDKIVKIHKDAFEGFFLTSLGTDFLKFYYSSFIKNHETVGLVAIDDDMVVGLS